MGIRLEDIVSCYSDKLLEKTFIVDLERLSYMKILFIGRLRIRNTASYFWALERLL
jgi:hypothetical protein